MTLPVVLRIEAQNEMEEARDWYDTQQPGVGADFLAECQKAFDRIKSMPESYAVLAKDVRAAKTRRFPYVIYYRIAAERIEVLAVIHGRRHSREWRQRI
jgi:plasmid stabilization system protein ParE